jgi:Amt family ammonium transporter
LDFFEWLRVDDPIGAVAVHAVAGIWGTLSIGLFASGYGVPGPDGAVPDPAIKGLFYGGGLAQLWVQFIGSMSCLVFVSLASIIVFWLIKRLRGSWNLRLERDLELEGIDINEHGLTAYHMEFGQGMTYVTTSGLAPPPPVGVSAAPPTDGPPPSSAL